MLPLAYVVFALGGVIFIAGSCHGQSPSVKDVYQPASRGGRQSSSSNAALKKDIRRGTCRGENKHVGLTTHLEDLCEDVYPTSRNALSVGPNDEVKPTRRATNQKLGLNF